MKIFSPVGRAPLDGGSSCSTRAGRGGDPWADFLHHRVRVLAMFRAEGKTLGEICDTMHMTSYQVESILDHYDSHRAEFDDAPAGEAEDKKP